MEILAHAAGHLYSCPKFRILREWVSQGFLWWHPQCLGMLWAYLESLHSLHFLLERVSMTTVSFSTISPFNERRGRRLQILLNLPGSKYLCVKCIWTLAAVLADFYSRRTSPRAFLSLQRAIQVPSAPAFLDIHCVQGIYITSFNPWKTTPSYQILLFPIYTWENRGSEWKNKLLSHTTIKQKWDIYPESEPRCLQEERFLPQYFFQAGKYSLSNTVRSALMPCGASVIRAECGLHGPPLYCCDTLLLSRMPHLMFCQKVV